MGADAGAAMLAALRQTREAFERGTRIKARVDEIERSINELFARAGRPGAEGGYGGRDLERKSAAVMCIHRHDLQVPKRDGAQSEYVPSFDEIEDAMMATKAIRSLLRHGDIERLPGEARKSLTSFNFGNSGWILAPQMADRVLSCLIDQTNVASLMGQATISAGSIVFPINNVDMTDSVGWACEADCAVN